MENPTQENINETEAPAPEQTRTAEPQASESNQEQSVKTPVNSAQTANINGLTQEEIIFGVIAYASLACVVPLLLKPKSAHCQFHGRQGVIVFLLSIFILFVMMIIPGLGLLLFFAYFALVVIAMYRAYIGEEWEIPVIGIFARKVDLNKIELPHKSETAKSAQTEAPVQPPAQTQAPTQAGNQPEQK